MMTEVYAERAENAGSASHTKGLAFERGATPLNCFVGGNFIRFLSPKKPQE